MKREPTYSRERIPVLFEALLVLSVGAGVGPAALIGVPFVPVVGLTVVGIPLAFAGAVIFAVTVWIALACGQYAVSAPRRSPGGGPVADESSGEASSKQEARPLLVDVDCRVRRADSSGRLSVDDGL